MESVKVLKSTRAEFTAAVIGVLPAWKFAPAIMQGAKVNQLVQQAFEFAPPPRE